MSFQSFIKLEETKKYIAGDIRKPLGGKESWAPWVKVYFEDGAGEVITVGNQSSPDSKNILLKETLVEPTV